MIIRHFFSNRLVIEFCATLEWSVSSLKNRHCIVFIGYLVMKLLLLKQFTKEDWQRYFPQIDFSDFKVSDNIRIVIQSLWLLIFKQNFSIENWTLLKHVGAFKKQVTLFFNWQRGLIQNIFSSSEVALEAYLSGQQQSDNKPFIIISMMLTFLAWICVVIPYSVMAQAALIIIVVLLALSVRHCQGRLPRLLLIVLSVAVSLRYIWWRSTSSVYWERDIDATLGLVLLLAEAFTWVVLFLSYFQKVWPLNRAPTPLPSDLDKWPSIDIFIPTYDEPIGIVRPTVMAAAALDWPKEKLNIYLLDDGKRDDFAAFAEQLQIGYIRRPTNEHAKAGNLNYALAQTAGDLIAIFDCDHIPTRAFLQITVGAFLVDPKLALVQTPHHFFSADPFERNLELFREKPNEGQLFHGLIQDGNDLWNATFFCGSCAVLRRQPLQEIGGIATETVTEDAHTALKLHRLGYRSRYLRLPLAAGLATDSFSAHIGQRIRWARGMAQIFRIDNPILKKGLSWQQRLCYLNAMLYFFSGIPRIIFMLAPLVHLYFEVYLIWAPALMVLLYVLPHLWMAYITNSAIQGTFRRSFWGEIYETALAWYIAVPTTIALFFPHKGKFNVTPKGGVNDQSQFDWKISMPALLLLFLNLAGLILGLKLMLFEQSTTIGVNLINILWTCYNILLLGVVLAVAAEKKQQRHAHRVKVKMSASVLTKEERHYPATLEEFSFTGMRLKLDPRIRLELGDQIRVALERYGVIESFAAEIRFCKNGTLGLKLMPMTIEKEKKFVQSTFARSDIWPEWNLDFKQEKILQSFHGVVLESIKGFKRTMQHSPATIRAGLKLLAKLAHQIGSFGPKWVV
ncbi:UDP-forming cellulose synthase catalytic subunit [Paraferrimonas sp. SM1919]|uniref:UDP-forming cellulose synthase catalytic subunit n=1 Tax=Paraferrimonas sp. SM1919 TaxID=2662263 RepID=UPI0013D89056|nr:UDP-forming cellulose synthase catalytic subunit [Paraferrimonas sp. SM1919]